MADCGFYIGIDMDGIIYDSKKRQNAELPDLPYDSKSSRTGVSGRIDNDGFQIDIVGNRPEPVEETEEAAAEP